MKPLRPVTHVVIVAAIAVSALAQSSGDGPRFEVADVHVTPKALANTFMEANSPRNDRYEFHSASMIDLIQLAYGFDDDRILGGPSWLEMDRFEVIAKVPAGTSSTPPPGTGPGTLPDAVRVMLQSLLADRFNLVIHPETRPLPGFALTVGRKPQMKEADGAGDTGCRFLPPSDPADAPIFQFACRNMRIDALAAFLPRLLDTGGVVDETELKGLWNFDLKWPRNASAQTAAEAIDKQLGLKLEPRQIPTPMLAVESVNETPGDNPPGVAEALSMAPQPTAFDVANFKPTDPAYPGYTSSLSPQPGGMWVSRGVTLPALLIRAFSPSYAQRNEDLVLGMPDWARTTRFDLTARSPAGAPASARAGPMVRSLLEERLKLKWHTEERPVSVYVLVADKPKMKKADPASRTHCLPGPPPAGSPPGAQSLTCQNITMEQFAEIIRPRLPGPGSPIFDSTGLAGGWDFTLTAVQPRVPANPGGEQAQQASAAVSASDPNGGLTITEALEKQLGLALKTQKRPMTVTVIDHLEQKPTEN